MRLQTKLTLTILPFTVLAIVIMALTSVNIIGKSTKDHFRNLMHQELVDFIDHTVQPIYDLLLRNQLEEIESFVKNYQNKVLAQAETFHLLESGNLLILDAEGALLHQVSDQKALNPKLFQNLAQEISRNQISLKFGYYSAPNQKFSYQATYYEPWKWVILYVLPETVTDQAKLKVAKYIAVIGLLLVLGTCSLIVIALRHFFVTPVTYLKNSARKIAELGEIPEVVVKSDDELGELSSSMQRLAESIKVYKTKQENWHERMETEIENRSRDLYKINLELKREIESRKRTESELRLSEKRFQAIFESTNDCILVWDKEYNYLYANQAAIDHVGTTRDKVIGKNIQDGLGHVPEFMKLWIDRIDQSFRSRQPFRVEDTAIVGDQEIYSESVLSPILDTDGNMFAVGVIYRDVTERKRMEERIAESWELNQKIIFSSPLGITAYADDGQCILANDAATVIIGADREKILEQNFYTIESWKKSGLLEVAKKVLDTGNNLTLEINTTSTFGKPAWIDVRLSRFTLLGKPHLLLIFDDIYDRKKLEEQLRNSLREKEILLKEIHHRVKNNLQVVASLLKMQAGQSNDAVLLECFKESQNRINSMALVHEQLYKSDNLATIDFNSYLKDLSSTLQHSFTLGAENINIVTSVQEPTLGLDTAIPCGLIVNELLTNAFKYAFGNSQPGIIEISFHLEGKNRAILTVKDNGIGIGRDFNISQTQTLGLKLVYSLVTHQLEGEINIISDNGTIIEISFPYSTEVESSRMVN